MKAVFNALRRLVRAARLSANEVHGALGLAGRAEEPLTSPALEPALTTSLPPAAPTTASWPISDAPASLNIKLKIGNMEFMLTMRDVDDLQLQTPGHHEPALAPGDPARL